MLSLTYVSTMARDIAAAELAAVLATSRPKNAAAGITGMLLYSDGNVIQTLEGPEEAVDATFAVIERDPRHYGIIVMLRQDVEERAFPDWSMGFRQLGRQELAGEEGVNTFLSDRGDEPSVSSARLLLQIFRDTMR